MPPRWLAANVAYMQDVEFLTARMGTGAATPRTPRPPPTLQEDPAGLSRAAKAKAKAAAKAAAARGGAGAAP